MDKKNTRQMDFLRILVNFWTSYSMTNEHFLSDSQQFLQVNTLFLWNTFCSFHAEKKNNKSYSLIKKLKAFFALELRNYKNDSIMSEDKLALNLPRFFTRLYGQCIWAAISKLICLWTKWCRSYFAFALKRGKT